MLYAPLLEYIPNTAYGFVAEFLEELAPELEYTLDV